MSKGVAPIKLSRDRIAIVTGANSGIGYEIAKGIASFGATVIVACRSKERGTRAIQQMKEEIAESQRHNGPGVTDSLSLEFMKLDLASYQSVLDFVEAFKKSGRKLHVLFCNAGMGLQHYALTDDGHERVLQVNYLGHFVLAAKLQPVMRQSGQDCRLLVNSSSLHSMCHYDINTVEYKGQPRNFPAIEYYSRSKLYQIMQMYSMVRRLGEGSNITVTCFCPGPTKTSIGEGKELKGCLSKSMYCFARTFGKSPEKAARLLVDCSVSPKYEGSTGLYYVSGKQKPTSRVARNEQHQEAMWQKSFEMVGRYITDLYHKLMNMHFMVTCLVFHERAASGGDVAEEF